MAKPHREPTLADIDVERDTIRQVLAIRMPELAQSLRITSRAVASFKTAELRELDKRVELCVESLQACRGLVAAELEARRLRGEG